MILALILAVFVRRRASAPGVADARRIGGGSSAGMQRSLHARTPPAAPPAPPLRPPSPPAPATAGWRPPRSRRASWMGPLAGLAAGLGMAALVSHFGMGAEMGNLVTLVLLALVAWW